MSSLKRVAITGSSGFYARALISIIREQLPETRILGLDVVEPTSDAPDELVLCDVTDSSIVEHLEKFEPDTIIHLAFVVNPMHNKQRMQEINVGGTRNVLEAVGRISPERLLVSSSATAYGAWDDNPIPISEDHPIRAREDYQYAVEKVKVEEMLAEFVPKHPEISVSWTRPAIIYGKGVNNYLTEFISKVMVVILPDGHDAAVQFVHLNDVAAATLHILLKGGRGPYNVGPPDWITFRKLAKIKRRFCFSLPMFLLRGYSSVWWTLRLPVTKFPPSLWNFIRYPWVVDPTRLRDELGYEFQYTTEQTIRQMITDGGWTCGPEETQPSTVDEPVPTSDL